MNARRYRRIGLTLAVAAGLFAVGACGTDSAPGSGSGDVGTDGGGFADAGEARVAASIDVGLDPDKFVYATGDTVTAEARVFDRSDAEISDPPLTWSVSPSDAAENVGPGQFVLDSEGEVSIEACTSLSVGPEICGTADVIVDSSPPEVQITSPEPGAFLGGSSGSRTITVEGQVSDSSGNLSAQLNGKPVELSEDGTFSTEIPAEFGVNDLRLTASDGRNKSTPTAVRQVFWAPQYQSLTSENSTLRVNTTDGVAFNIGQNFFDDAMPPEQRPSESDVVARDLADVLNLIISNIDFASQLPNPLIDTSSANLTIDSVEFGRPVVAADLTDSGLQAFVHVDQLVLQTSGSVSIEGTRLSLNGSIQGRLSAFVDVTLERDSSSGNFSTTVDTLELSIDRLEPSFADQKANAIFELAESTLRASFEQRLVDTLRTEVVSLLPELLDQQLNSLESSLTQQTFQFGSETIGTTEVQFEGNIDSFDISFRDAIEGLLGTEVSISGADQKSSAPGTPLMAPDSSAVPWFQQSRLQVALRMRLVNGLLTALWKTGFLDLDLTGSLPENISGLVETANLSGKLPPVLRPARGDEPYDLVMEIGQLELDTEARGRDDLYGLRIQAGVDVSLENNKLELSVPDDPTIEAWVISASDEEPFLEPESLVSLILDQVWPSLESSIQDGLAIDLPAPSLSVLQNVSPTLSRLVLEYRLPRPVSVRDGYLMLDAEFRGVLPLGGN